MRRFEGRTAVITGGGAGIGLATALRIGSEGGRVALLDCAADDLKRVLSRLESAGVESLGIQGDVASRADCERVTAAACERWGGVDVLVANAAVRAYGSVLDAPDQDWERVLAVNLRGVANAAAAAGQRMRARGAGGSMVLVSSAKAVRGRADMPLYDAAKAGVLSLTRSLAVDLAPDRVRVNSVCPGFVVTDFHIRRAEQEGRTADDLRRTRAGLFGRPAEPEELAAAIAFLASDEASYITGTNLMVDCGGHAV